MLTVETTITITVISIPRTAFSYIIFDRFFIARQYIARPSVCLSVCPLHGWISQKRLTLGL